MTHSQGLKIDTSNLTVRCIHKSTQLILDVRFNRDSADYAFQVVLIENQLRMGFAPLIPSLL